MSGRERVGLAGLMLGGALSACASTAGRFPSAAEVGELAASRASEKVAPEGVADVERWQLAGPFADAVANVPHARASGWDDLLAKAVAGRAGLALASESAHCVARETGLFYLGARGYPTEPLRRFIEGRCGVAGSEVSTGSRCGDVADSVSEQKLLDEWSDDVAGDLGKALGSASGPELAGIWFGRQRGRVVVEWAVVRRQVQVEPIPVVPAGGHVLVRGELLMQADHIQGLATAGPFGVRRCVADPQVALPRFALTCDLEPADPVSRVEIAAFPAGRILGPIVLSLLLWPTGAPSDTFTRPSIPDAAACQQNASGGDVARALTACINHARGRAQLAPLELAPAQSATAARLAPHFFAALAGSESELVADKVVLGMRAGWDVGAALRYGQFASGLVQGDAAVERLVAAVLDRPSGREALLDATVHRLAVGTVAVAGTQAGGAPGGQAILGAVFGTYALFDGRDDPRDAERVLERVTAARARKGLPPPHRLTSLEGAVGEAARRIAAEGRDPTSALNDALEVTAERTHAEVHGWWVDAAKLEDLEVPADVVQAPTLNVAVAVSHYRPPNDPWTRYVVVLVAAKPQETLALARAR